MFPVPFIVLKNTYVEKLIMRVTTDNEKPACLRKASFRSQKHGAADSAQIWVNTWVWLRAFLHTSCAIQHWKSASDTIPRKDQQVPGLKKSSGTLNEDLDDCSISTRPHRLPGRGFIPDTLLIQVNIATDSYSNWRSTVIPGKSN